MMRGFWVFKAGGAVFHGPDMPRGGLVGIFGGVADGLIGGTTCLIEVEHRDLADTTYGVLGTVVSVSGLTDWAQDLSGVKEVWRYKYSFTGGSDGDGFHMKLAAPTWMPS